MLCSIYTSCLAAIGSFITHEKSWYALGFSGIRCWVWWIKYFLTNKLRLDNFKTNLIFLSKFCQFVLHYCEVYCIWSCQLISLTVHYVLQVYIICYINFMLFKILFYFGCSWKFLLFYMLIIKKTVRPFELENKQAHKIIWFL